MLNEGAGDCFLPITRKESDNNVMSSPHRPHRQQQSPYPNHLVKKWTERVDRCLEQQWKDSQHLLSFAKALKDSGGTIINSDDIVKELSGLGFSMMQKSIDLRQEIVNESYNNDFFDCHIEKPNTYPYHHHPYVYSRPTTTANVNNNNANAGVLNSPRAKNGSTSFYLPLSSQLNRNTSLLSKVQKQSSIDNTTSNSNSPYKIPSQVSCQGYTYQQRQQRTRSESFTHQHRQLNSSSSLSNDKKICVPILSSSPSISNVCSLSLSDNGDKQQLGRNNNNQCTCNTANTSIESGKMTTTPTIRCQQCTLQLDRKDPTFDIQPITFHSNTKNNLATTPSPEPLIQYGTDNEQTTERENITRNENHGTLLSSTVNTDDDDIAKTTTTTTTTSAAVAPLAVHITPSTPSSSSSMIHTMSTKFHFTRSTTSTDKNNKTISRSSSSSSSSSSSAATTPLGRFSNKDGGKSSSTRLVQSFLGRKTSLPVLFSSSSSFKKDTSEFDI